MEYNKLPISQDPTQKPLDNEPLKDERDIVDLAPNQFPERTYDQVVNLSEPEGAVQRGNDVSYVTNTIIQGAGQNAAGSTGQIQFNTSDDFDADSQFTIDKDYLSTGYPAIFIGAQNSRFLAFSQAQLGDGMTVFTDSEFISGENLDGTSIEIYAGDATDALSGNGGQILLEAGEGDDSGGGGQGGHITISSGDCYSGGTPGNIYLIPGRDNDAGISAGSVIVKLLTLDDADGNSSFQLDNSGVAGGNISYRKMAADFTNNATPVAIANIFTLSANQAVLAEVRVTARRVSGSAGTDGDAATYIKSAGFKKPSSGASAQIGSTQNIFTAEDQAGWDVGFNLATDTVQLLVTGATNNDIYWSAEIYYLTSTTL